VQVRITLVKSVIGYSERHRRIVASLGLRRIGSSAVHQDSPSLRGMVRQVAHLVRCEPEEGASVRES
jgi:large subunit ribosomal protein L30